MRLKDSRLGGASALAVATLATPLAAGAQPAARVARVGFLSHLQSPGGPTLDSLRRGLRDLGWIEGQNLVLEHRQADGRPERLPALAAELVRLKVDVIVATSAALPAVASATKTIPIVFVVPDDPVATGLVTSLARPGGNLTGLTSLNVELEAKRLELLREAIPRLRRVAVLADRRYAPTTATLAVTERTARALGVQLHIIDMAGDADLDGAIASVVRAKGEALAIPGGSAMFFSQQPRMAELAAKARLPGISPWRQFPEAGGLMSYGANIAEMFGRAAVYVDKILRGASPAELPVEQSTRFELVINRRSAKSLGLVIPQSLIVRADQIID